MEKLVTVFGKWQFIYIRLPVSHRDQEIEAQVFFMFAFQRDGSQVILRKMFLNSRMGQSLGIICISKGL